MAKDLTNSLQKLNAYKKHPELVKEPTIEELAEITVHVLNQVNVVIKAIEAGKIAGKTPQKDVEYLGKETAIGMIRQGIADEISSFENRAENTISSVEKKGKELESQISESLAKLKNGTVTDKEIQRAASLALSLLELPDFEALVSKSITSSSEEIRNALELLQGEERYQVEISDVKGLEEALKQNTSGKQPYNAIGRNQVLQYIREGTPVDNQVGVWTGDGTLEGGAGLTFDSSINQLSIGDPTQTAGFADTPLEIGGEINSFLEIYARNTSNGDTASMDISLGNDIDTLAIASHYINVGISGSGYVGTTAANGVIKTVSVTAGGTGYTINDELTLTTGDGTAIVTVLTAPGGVVATVGVTNNGSAYVTGAGQATTGGTGTGCTINVLTLFDFSIYSANGGYLAMSGGELAIGTDDTIADRPIKFFTNGQATASERARIDTTGLTVGLTGSNLGRIKFAGSTSGVVTMVAPAAAGSGTLTLPTGTTVLVGRSTADTLTTKRIQPRTNSTTSAATLAPDLSTAEVYFRTTQTVTLAVSAPIGTPVIGESITMYITAAGAQTINWNATYIAYGAALPVLTVAGKTLQVKCQYDGTNWATTTALMV